MGPKDKVEVTPFSGFEVPPHLTHLSLSTGAFLQAHPEYLRLVVGALVFAKDRLLIVQRSASERAFPLKWEFPGGSCEERDLTVLHGLARELFEEAGLSLSRIVHQVGPGRTFNCGSWLHKEIWVKLSFIVEVEEADPHEQVAAQPPVKLDPQEHDQFAWATEEQVRQCDLAGTKLDFTDPAEREVILEAFRWLRDRSQAPEP